MTIKDIARLSGVGVATVSRVLNDHPDVSQETRRKVLAVVAEQGFQPNANAKHLKQPSSTSIAIIVKGTMNMLFADLVERCQQLFRLEHAHVGGAQAQVRRLEHHLRGGNGGVDLAVVLSVGLPLPGDGGIIRHRYKHRRMKMAAHAGVRFLQRLGRAKHKDALRLKVVGGGGIPAGLQNKGQLLLFHRPDPEPEPGPGGGGGRPQRGLFRL